MIFSDKTKKENNRLNAELLKNERRIFELNARIQALEKENARLSDQNNALNEKEKQLKGRLQKEETENRVLKDENAALKKKYGGFTDPEQSAAFSKQLEEQAVLRYNAELKRLAAYVERWQNALPEPNERTPATRKRAALCSAIYDVLIEIKEVKSSAEGERAAKRLNDAIGGAVEGSSFNLDEVLNPGKLDLETLCKELGVMD